LIKQSQACGRILRANKQVLDNLNATQKLQVNYYLNKNNELKDGGNYKYVFQEALGGNINFNFKHDLFLRL
jgi:hypothetical protein